MGLRSENRELFRTMTAGCSIISLLELVCTKRSIIIFIKSDWKNIRRSDYSDRRVLLVEDNDLNSEIASEIIGMTGASVEIVENGVKYQVDVKDGQKTGFFLDQKYNRLAIQRLCKGAKVLDCFTHTGSSDAGHEWV